MSAQPSFVLSDQQTVLLDDLASEMDRSSLLWTSGYLAGLANAQAVGAPVAPQPQRVLVEKLKLTVLYGSQTGNAKRVAEKLAGQAESNGLDVTLVRADEYKVKRLKDEKLLYVVISTHSEGDEVDPPDDSRDFLEALFGRRAPKVPDLKYAVLALGDTSYPDFCGIGRQLDERLAELGGIRLFDRGEADVDIETVAGPWTETALKEANELAEKAGAAQPQAAAAQPGVVTPLHPSHTKWTRENPYKAEVLLNQRVVASDSGKDVRHMELLLEGSGIHYQPGDSLGIWPVQSPKLVTTVIDALALNGDEPVTINDEALALSRWLGERRELTVLTRPFIVAHAERSGSEELQALVEAGPEARKKLAALLNGTQLIDLLRQYPAGWEAQAFVEALRPLAPRSYSIASSQKEADDEVHLTVERLHFKVDGEDRWGVATQHLCALNEGDTVPVFLDANDRFRLPQDASKDVIMIGPGTGVAPFRAFLQERAATDASGRNWLFFGNPHRRTDFLYQLEWQQALKKGELDHLDVAFSRDQDYKVYVQDRIREKGAEVWQWLDGGAHIYICGDADNMAPDVHAALIEVIAKHGGQSKDDATAWLKNLMSDGRYARDVY